MVVKIKKTPSLSCYECFNNFKNVLVFVLAWTAVDLFFYVIESYFIARAKNKKSDNKKKKL